MNRRVILAVVGVAVTCGSSFAMVGGPVFTVGQQMTSMMVEASQVEMAVPITEGGDDRETMQSRRLFLTGRYGVADNMDVEVKLGAADLTYSDLRFGFSEFSSSPSLAWGAGFRAGLPTGAQYQVTGSLSYLGYHAESSTASGNKSVSSNYLWQEIRPAVTVGYRFGEFIPYAGAMKPFLFGSREYSLAFDGQQVEAASGTSTYQDGGQAIRGLFGLEWRMPDGYSISGEASTTSSGTWILSVGIAQTIK